MARWHDRPSSIIRSIIVALKMQALRTASPSLASAGPQRDVPTDGSRGAPLSCSAIPNSLGQARPSLRRPAVAQPPLRAPCRTAFG